MDDRPFNGAIAQTEKSHTSSGDRPFKEMSAAVSHWFGQFHGWDYIYSDVVKGKANWKTAPNTERLCPYTLFQRWKDEHLLVGVRFPTTRDSKTSYLALDIDRNSPYHPVTDEAELRRLLGALELIGLIRYIPFRSSNSEGIHLYFPLPEPVLCTGLALAVQETLKRHHFIIEPGKLEIFPNVRTRAKNLYRGLRLPLQTDSFVLDRNWQPLHNSLERLINDWEVIREYQDLEGINKAIADYQGKSRQRRSAKLQEWFEEGQEVLQNGWTAHGQTNDHLQTLCKYARVFEGLEWEQVEEWVVKTVNSLPGYKRWCRHQHEIHEKTRGWIQWLTKNKNLYPVGSKFKKKERKAPSNRDREQEAYQRIQGAIATLKQQSDELPKTVRKRQNLICQLAKCSPSTLYKYKELWHPNFDCKVSVTPDSIRVSEEFSEAKQQVRSVGLSVTSSPTRVLAVSLDTSLNPEIAETQTEQSVTAPLLLSVNSPNVAEEQYKRFCTQSKIRVGDIVRWKKFNSLFRVKKLNSNETVWAKRLNHPVDLVDTILKLDEIELIESQRVNHSLKEKDNGL